MRILVTHYMTNQLIGLNGVAKTSSKAVESQSSNVPAKVESESLILLASPMDQTVARKEL